MCNNENSQSKKVAYNLKKYSEIDCINYKISKVNLAFKLFFNWLSLLIPVNFSLAI